VTINNDDAVQIVIGSELVTSDLILSGLVC